MLFVIKLIVAVERHQSLKGNKRTVETNDEKCESSICHTPPPDDFDIINRTWTASLTIPNSIWSKRIAKRD